jgi:hypothetical protein
VRAAATAEDGSVASMSALERVCLLVAEETPDLVSLAVEYQWRRKRFHDPVGARDLLIPRVLAYFTVTCVALAA